MVQGLPRGAGRAGASLASFPPLFARNALSSPPQALHVTGEIRGGGSIDEATEKEPYAFVCGDSDVVRGLSLGVAGMRVGGRRVITCPYKFAYGAKGSLPKVPPKSPMRFDVTLLDVGAGFVV